MTAVFPFKPRSRSSGIQRRWPGWGLALGLVLSMGSMGVPSLGFPVLAQEDPTSVDLVSPADEEDAVIPAAPTDGLYFADILVRGRPVFQVGSLADLSATQRASIINRRIGGLLAQVREPETAVIVQEDPQRQIATLQLNNRVLMTVTQQDAEDFGVTVPVLAQQWGEQLNAALQQQPLAIDVVQRLNATTRQLLRNTIDNLPSFLGALIAVGVTWAIAKGVRFAAFQWAQRTEGDRSSEILISRLGYGGVWVIGSVVALGILGLEFGALLGALGLTSVAIGFSLKDVLSNYISGVILLAARPFRLGDQVVIRDYEGTVCQIQLRATTIKTYDGRMVYIPNQQVFQASITNNTASGFRRSSIMVGIDYDADIGTAKQLMKKAVLSVEGVESDPGPDILVRELAASTINIEVRFWVNSRRLAFLDTTSYVAQAIKETLQEHEIDMPTEIHTLVFRNPISLDGAKGRQLPGPEEGSAGRPTQAEGYT